MKKMIGMFLMAGAIFGADPTHHDTYKWPRQGYVVFNHDLTENDAVIKELAINLIEDSIKAGRDLMAADPIMMLVIGLEAKPVPFSVAIGHGIKMYQCAVNRETGKPCGPNMIVLLGNKEVVFSQRDYTTAYVLYRELWKVIEYDHGIMARINLMRWDYIQNHVEPNLDNIETWLCMDCRIRIPVSQ